MAKDSTYRFIKTVGGLLPSEVLQRIAALDPALGVNAEDYHLVGERIPEAISRSWGRMLAVWANFQSTKQGLTSGEAGTGVTRDKLLLPLFNELGYGRLPVARGLEVQGKSFPISHVWNGVPLHLVGAGVELDRRTAGAIGAAKQSPHGLMQEYLNRSEALWGVVSNGLRLRLLRDNATLTRQAYVEFDLEGLFEAEAYPDFALLWMLLHESRLYKDGQSLSECPIELWQQRSAEQGKRALNQLREGVSKALNQLGSGFLAHPANTELKQDLRSGALSPQDYYRQLLRLVYRLLFMFVAEDRDSLLEAVGEGLEQAERERLEGARKLYNEHYSTARLRNLAERIKGTRHADLYQAHRLIAGYLAEGGAAQLALKPLDSFLFNPESTAHLSRAELSNRDFLDAVRSLAFTLDGTALRSVDYKNLGAEELGSVYEQLLELVAEVNIEAAHFELKNLAGNERKTSGSYYTPTSLIEVVLDEALEPKLAQAAQEAAKLSGEQKKEPFLSLKVLDPAVGSGHFLIAAAHRIAKRMAQAVSGDDEPAPEGVRSALREVILNCLYGVDLNPMSAELCKVALWIESAEPGKPLGFLDHHIKVGNSLVGAPIDFYEKGIGQDAYRRSDVPKSLLKGISYLSGRKLEEWRRQLRYQTEITYPRVSFPPLAKHANSLEEVQALQKAYLEWRNSEAVGKAEYVADYWTAAWFAQPSAGERLPDMNGLSALAQKLEVQPPKSLEALLRESAVAAEVAQAKKEHRFFHWWLEFADVFFNKGELRKGGGFDVVLGNPPWDVIQAEEKSFFSGLDDRIANVDSGAKRKQLIEQLAQEDPALYQLWTNHANKVNNTANFISTSGRFPLTGSGKINLYSSFAELVRSLLSRAGYCGIIVPTGIATDDSNKEFFADLVEQGQLAALLDFENRDALFPAVDSRQKFCILATRGRDARGQAPAKLTFFAANTDHLRQSERVFSLSSQDFALLNPNTRTCPVFRSKTDAELSKKIYRRVPVLWREAREVENLPEGALFPSSGPLAHGNKVMPEENPWGIRFRQGLFNMTSDSGLFKTRGELEKSHYQMLGNRMVKEGSVFLPLYEAKLFHHFDHRFATYEGSDTRDMSPSEHARPEALPQPRYWVAQEHVDAKLALRDRNGDEVRQWTKAWLLSHRKTARSTDFRTTILSLLPRIAVGDKAPLIFSKESAHACIFLLANMNSLTLDFVARCKVGATDLSQHYLMQFPVLPPSTYTQERLEYIVPRVLELTYTAWDLAPFAQDVWQESDAALQSLLRKQWQSNGGHSDTPPSWVEGAYPFPPFRWDEERRANLRAELDAYYAKLYGLEREELQYILDPQSVKGPDFPSETFRVLKDKEIKAFGEYRTQRLVLEAWDRM